MNEATKERTITNGVSDESQCKFFYTKIGTGRIIPIFHIGKPKRANLFIEAFQKTQEELKLSGIDATNSGSTAVTVLISGFNLICANVGDSRAILGSLTKDNKWSITLLSIDHKPELKPEYDRIIKAKGQIEPYKSNNLIRIF